MKHTYFIILQLYWSLLIVSCEKCSDPFISGRSVVIHKAKLTPNLDLAASDAVVFSDFVGIFGLSESPLVEYVMLGYNGSYLTFQLREPYDGEDPDRNYTVNGGIVQFGKFGDIPENNARLTELLRSNGASKWKAFAEMKDHCDLVVLKKDQDATVLFLITTAVAALCYTALSAFNYTVNYSTLKKTYVEKQKMVPVFFALSQSLTSRRISKFYHLQNEKMYFDLYTKMTDIGANVKGLEEKVQIYSSLTENKKLSECIYDYVESA